MVVVLCGVMVVCVLLALVQKEKTVEELIPTSFLSIITFLFPFYCFDMLRTGRNLLLILFVVISIWALHKIKWRELCLGKIFTPGIFIYVVACLIIVMLTKDNFVSLWDETRLWGAVPKALWYTETLQLGEEALIYPIMQSYYPGMPLLVYFMTSIGSEFSEWQIFAIYGIFVLSLLIPAFRKMKWNQWILVFPLAIASVILPCLATSHGGDSAYFYDSLFVDVVLGAVIGYSFYLTTQNPLKDWWTVYSFVVSLVTLVLLKDTGILFASVILINSFILSVLRKKEHTLKRCLLCHVGMCLVSFGMYFAWQHLLSLYMVKNHVGMRNLFSKNAIYSLIKNLLKTEMISLNGKLFNTKLQLTFFLCILVAICGSIYLTRKYKDLSTKEAAITVVSMAISAIIFGVGFCFVYGAALPSFQRYIGGTILNAVFTYMALRIFYVIVNNISLNDGNKKIRSYRIILILIICIGGMIFLADWNITKKFIGNPYEKAEMHSSRIQAILDGYDNGKTHSIYLYNVGKEVENCLLHQRIYMNLIGSEVSVKNFYDDVQIKVDDGELKDEKNVKEIAEQWLDKIVEEYDYVYVISVNEFTEMAFEIFAESPPTEMSLYEVDSRHRKLVLLEE